MCTDLLTAFMMALTVTRRVQGVIPLPVDWKIFDAALRQSRDGNQLKAISILSALLSDAETTVTEPQSCWANPVVIHRLRTS